MKHIDVRFDASMVQMLEVMVGREFEMFKCDPLEYSTLVYGLVGLYIGGAVYELDNFLEIHDFYGHQEDVAIFRLRASEDTEIQSMGDGVQMVETPVKARISRIRIVDENQQLFYNGEQTYDVWVTRGIIFDLEDGREVSFEKSVWFSEFINVQRGYDLLEAYQSTDSFLEEWEGNEGYTAKCQRSIRILDKT